MNFTTYKEFYFENGAATSTGAGSNLSSGLGLYGGLVILVSIYPRSIVGSR